MVGDPECTQRGILCHLHRGDRPTLSAFNPEDSFYRRYPFNSADMSSLISFDPEKNSVNLARLCNEPADVLVRESDGKRLTDQGVAEIPASVLHHSKWKNEEGHEYTTQFIHNPLQCNYPHSDMVLIAPSGEVVQKGKASGMKMRIREEIRTKIKIRLPTVVDGKIFALVKASQLHITNTSTTEALNV